MSNSWQAAYEELQGFIAEKPEVVIGESMISIPGDVRPEFYRLFDTVRVAFVEEKFPALLNEGGALSENYLKVEQEITELLGLDGVSMVASLGRFLHDPRDELRRGLFDLLFGLLKGKVDIETFETGALGNIKASFRSLYRKGYEKWLAISLVKLLKADKLFQVILARLDRSQHLRMAMQKGTKKEGVPPPQESKRISFDQTLGVVLFTIPDFIVHSAKINRYIAIRQQTGKGLITATNASEKREWYPLDSVGALWPGATLLYVADKPEEISLVADFSRICKPDLIIECREQKDWYEKEGLAKVKLNHDSLKPTLGTYIVSREPVPEEKLGENIHLLVTGFDQSKLTPIIDVLTSPIYAHE